MLPKIPVISKNASNKSCSKLSFLQKTLQAHMSISPKSGARGSKDCHVWNIIMYWNGKVDSLYGSILSKIRITSKNASNKSCSESNFVWRIQRAHMSMSHRSGARELQRLPCLKYFNVLKRESRHYARFTMHRNLGQTHHNPSMNLRHKTFMSWHCYVMKVVMFGP